MYFLDYYIEAIAEQNAFKHAIRNAQDVFKNNEAIDMTQKLSNAERNTFRTSKEIDEGEGSSLYKNGMKVYNNLQTAAGRGLMTADEFFATMSFNRTLMVLAYKRAHNIYAKTGKIEDAQREFIKTLTDFDPEDIDGAGKALDIATSNSQQRKELIENCYKIIKKESSIWQKMKSVQHVGSNRSTTVVPSKS